MEIEDLAAALHSHEGRSQQRYEKLCETLKGTTMSEPTHIKNIFEPNPMGGVMPFLGSGLGGAGAGAGAGLGAGLLGGVLGGALLGGRGLFGNEGRRDTVSPEQLTTAITGVIDSQQNTSIASQLGRIEAAIPYNESQVQLALAGSTASIVGGQALINKNISEAIAASLASQNNINVNVLQQGSQTREAVASYGVANLTATKDAQFAVVTAVANSTKEILAALNEQNTANLQRQLTVAEQALLETRAEGRARGTEVNVTQTVNQNQMQLQAQQQQQQQAILLDRLCTAFGSLQNAVATNSNMIIGNTGAVGTGPQTANPVNVRT